VTSGHSLFDVETEKDIECREHRDEAVRFYCEPCDMCICILCTFNEHRDHDIAQFSDAVGKYKDNIRALLADCQVHILMMMVTWHRCHDLGLELCDVVLGLHLVFHSWRSKLLLKNLLFACCFYKCNVLFVMAARWLPAILFYCCIFRSSFSSFFSPPNVRDRLANRHQTLPHVPW